MFTTDKTYNTKKQILIVLFLLCAQFANSQELVSITEYQKKIPVIENWLREQNLNQVLSVHEIKIDSGILELYLAFKIDNEGWASSAWDTLKTSFERQKPYEFEEYMFFNMAGIFKVPLPRANIQLYDTYDENIQPCFYTGIWFDTTERKVKSEYSFCKSKTTKTVIYAGDLKNIRNVQINLGNENLSRRLIYEKILGKMKRYYRYEKKLPDFENNFVCDYSGYESVLEFEIKNIRQEILYEEDDWLCNAAKWLYEDFDCDWRKKEYIKVKVEYISTSGGLVLEYTIDGRYGSSSTSTFIWERCNPMEPEYVQYVEQYAQKMKRIVQYELGLN